MKNNNSFLGQAFVLLLGLLLFLPPAYARDIPQKLAVRIIVSEAANQGLKGMVCVAEVLRRRGSTRGFYGDRSIKANWHTHSILAQARKAWEISKHTNFTKGADHFENIHAFGNPWWAKHCVITYIYRDHVFFKELPPT